MLPLFIYVHMILQIKSMAQHLHQTGNLKASRKNLFPTNYHYDLQYLNELIAIEIAEKHIKRFEYARRLNTSLAFFFMDALSLMDRGFIFFLIRNYIKKVKVVSKAGDWYHTMSCYLMCCFV